MLLSDREEELVKCLTNALSTLASEVHVLHQQRAIEFEWFRLHSHLATKNDLREMENRIMATQAEIVADLKSAVVNLKQVNVDIADTQKQINELKTAIIDLQKLVDAGGGITPELVEAVAEVKALAAAADEALPNTVVVPPAPV